MKVTNRILSTKNILANKKPLIYIKTILYYIYIIYTLPTIVVIYNRLDAKIVKRKDYPKNEIALTEH